jgi:cytochrome c oxidase assembly factor CtaG
MRAVKGLLALAMALAARPALAHGDDPVWSLDAAWTSDPLVLAPLYAVAILNLVGTLRVWRRAGHGRGVRRVQALAFWTGWTVLALALLSPLHWLSERLFTAHMVEHELLMAVAAPLLVLARPGGALLWAFPLAWRQGLGGVGQSRTFAALWRWHTDPLAATVMHAVAIWAWHLPSLFEAALLNTALHWLQHLSFLVTGLFFWWALIFGRARRRGYGAAVLYLFATSLHTGVLGALLAISRQPWYPVQTAFAAEWGLTPLEDQQLAGLVMWVPAGLIYLGAALAMMAIWIQTSSHGGWKGGELAHPAP